MARDGRSDLIGASDDALKIAPEEVGISLECAYSCPVNVIHILEGDERLI